MAVQAACSHRTKDEHQSAGTSVYFEGEQSIEGPGLSCFLRDGDSVFHTYSTFARGTETVGGSHYFLELTALGRQEDWEQPKGPRDRSQRRAVRFGVSRVAIDGSTVDDDADTITRIDALVADERRVRSRLSQGHPLTPEDERHLADLEKRLDHHCWELLRRQRSHRHFGHDPDSGRAWIGARPRHGNDPRAERSRR